MAQEKLQQNQEQTRDIDPNVRQRQAADPQNSVWVNASAGTGKTKVLTDRVLRLLLPREHAERGAPPHKILCLTFTKAGASEMSLRIHETLGAWSIMDKDKLTQKLESLLSRTVTDEDLQAARRLFASVIDISGGLKIMTIHSFCQSVLSRFPLEAGLPPSFTVLEEEQSRTLIEQAKHSILSRTEDEGLGGKLQQLAATLNESQFNTMLQTLLSERGQLKDILTQHFGAEGVHAKLCEMLNIQTGDTVRDIKARACEDNNFDLQGLRGAAQNIIANDSKSYAAKADMIAHWLSLDINARQNEWDSYISAFFTTDGQIRKKLAGAKISDDIRAYLEKEALRLHGVREAIKAIQTTALTRDLLYVGHEILDAYAEIKAQRAALDFDDLIYKTETLLRQENGAAWVMYKLDQGLDHILVDEAQDTNPEQWRIIDALSDVFFDEEQPETARTFFAVGDQKQSIYSFQRASPDAFNTMKERFGEKVTQMRQNWAPVDLNISFRSVPTVLQVVDQVFADDNARKGLGAEAPIHQSFRRRQAGHVELWPRFEAEEQPGFDPWTPPTEIVETKSPSMQAAGHIAQTIKSWLDRGEGLPSHDRPIQPGDIMILVRTRTAFVNQLMRALKAHDIPVSGTDRMVLSQQLVIEDLNALICFALLPDDDLTLASVLKSPLIGLSEDDLYALCVDREGSVWDRLQNSQHQDIAAYLRQVINTAKTQRPFGFLSTVLQNPCPANPVSGLCGFKTRLGPDCSDAIEEFLNTALNYERNETPSLQGFVSWQQKNEIEIKRELSEHTGQVRIMTVHGSKGLQAPIVILPDTIHAQSRSRERLLWPDKTGFPVPIWSPHRDLDTEAFKDAASRIKDQDDEEYRRLLYVAMTRAEDRLYIAGHSSRQSIPEDCWYELIRRGMKGIENVEEFDDGGLRITGPQIGEPDHKKDFAVEAKEKTDLPVWAREAAPTEPYPPKPLAPSRPSTPDNHASLSPLEAASDQRFERGNMTHRLLELLPEIAPEKRQEIGQSFLAKYSQITDKWAHSDVLKSVINILEDEKFGALFGPGSEAEVPITGFINGGRLISGQIDRLLVNDEEIWIVDYKTGHKIPEHPEHVPENYKNQLKAYADTLKEIYPGRKVHCALLWTDGPVLMPVDIT